MFFGKIKYNDHYLTLFGVGKTVLILEPERELAQIIDVVNGKVPSSRPHRVLLGVYQHHSGSGSNDQTKNGTIPDGKSMTFFKKIMKRFSLKIRPKDEKGDPMTDRESEVLFAIINNNESLYQSLDKLGFNVNVSQNDLLRTAIKVNRLSFVKLLIQSGADAADPQLIKDAVCMTNLPIIEELLKNGADARIGLESTFSTAENKDRYYIRSDVYMLWPTAQKILNILQVQVEVQELQRACPGQVVKNKSQRL